MSCTLNVSIDKNFIKKIGPRIELLNSSFWRAISYLGASVCWPLSPFLLFVLPNLRVSWVPILRRKNTNSIYRRLLNQLKHSVHISFVSILDLMLFVFSLRNYLKFYVTVRTCVGAFWWPLFNASITEFMVATVQCGFSFGIYIRLADRADLWRLWWVRQNFLCFIYFLAFFAFMLSFRILL